MTWFEQSANQTESEKLHVLPFLAVDFDFLSGHARFWSSYGDLVIGGNTFTGAGHLGRVSSAVERDGLDAPRKSFALAGTDISPMLISDSDIEGSFERLIIEYVGFLDATTRVMVGTPEVQYWLIDSIRRVDGLEPAIEVNAENRMKLLERASDWRYTHEHQQQFYPGDTGFSLVGSSLLREIVWGGKLVSSPGGPGRGGAKPGTTTDRQPE